MEERPPGEAGSDGRDVTTPKSRRIHKVFTGGEAYVSKIQSLTRKTSWQWVLCPREVSSHAVCVSAKVMFDASGRATGLSSSTELATKVFALCPNSGLALRARDILHKHFEKRLRSDPALAKGRDQAFRLDSSFVPDSTFALPGHLECA